MNSVVALVIGIAVALVGYYGYARYIDTKVIKADPKKATPAKMYMDGVDFIPTSKYVLFGYQFKSIAALGPVLGPIIALQWGWLPALIWILAGTFFIGWVQDYSAAMLGLRNDGETLTSLSFKLISPRARTILLSFIYFYLLLILAAFNSNVSGLLNNVSSVPLAIIALMVVGIVAGILIYKRHLDIIFVTILMVILSLVGVWVGTRAGITAPAWVWNVAPLVFSFIGAILPLWVFTQPINYISFYLIFLGMLGAMLGILIGHPTFTAPAFVSFNLPGLGPLWPILFVTVACGAISGWHSLVSTSGSARQLESETDARFVAGGSMFLEMLLATLALIIGAATFENFDKFKEVLKASKPIGVFTVGLSNLLAKFGISEAFGKAFAGAMLVILALTIMQLVVRFMRIATAELAGKVTVLRNMYLGAIISCVLAWALVVTGTWSYIWTLFGGSNQLMAGLALMMVSIWLSREGRAYAWTLVPSLFMMVTTLGALGWLAYDLINKCIKLGNGTLAPAAGKALGLEIGGNAVSAAIALFLMVAALILAVDGVAAVFRAGKKAAPAAPAAPSGATATK